MPESYSSRAEVRWAALRERAVLLAERDHEPPQELVELILLRSRSAQPPRSIPSRPGRRSLCSQSSRPRGSELDHDAAPVVRIGEPPNQVRLLHLVEPRRHRPTREAELAAELPGRAPVRRPAVAERAQHLHLAPAEAELLQRLVVGAAEVASGSSRSGRRCPRCGHRDPGSRAAQTSIFSSIVVARPRRADGPSWDSPVRVS